MVRPNLLTPERVLIGVLLAGLAVGCTFVLIPFLPAIIWAVILAYSTYPVFEWLRARLNVRRGVAALLMVLITAILVVLPLALVVPAAPTT